MDLKCQIPNPDSSVPRDVHLPSRSVLVQIPLRSTVDACERVQRMASLAEPVVWIPRSYCRSAYQDQLRGVDLVVHRRVRRVVCPSSDFHQLGVFPAAEGSPNHR